MYLQDYLSSQGDDVSKGSKDSRRSRKLAMSMDGTISHHDQQQAYRSTSRFNPRNTTITTMTDDGSYTKNSSFVSDGYCPSDTSSYMPSEAGEEAILIIDDDEYSLTNKNRRNKKRCFLVGTLVLFMAAVIAAATIGAMKSQESKAEKAASASMMQLESCQAGIVQDTKQHKLEIYLRGPTELIDSSMKTDLEVAISTGYNDASGGCLDQYQRIMYDVKLANQTIVRDLVLADKTESLSTLFEESTFLVAHFDTWISSRNCPEEEVFASRYPASFGNIISAQPANRRSLEADLPVGSGIGPSYRSRNLQTVLDAATVVLAIEKAVRQVMPEVQGFKEVTVMVSGQDGSSAASTLYEDRESNESYRPSFFRDKAIKDAQQLRDDCESAAAGRKYRKGTGSSTKASGSSTKASGSSTKASGSSPKSSKTSSPTRAPTTAAPTVAPSSAPTTAPTTAAPTVAPSSAPTTAPTTAAPTVAPSSAPTTAPTTAAPTLAPSTLAPTTSAAPTTGGKKSGKKGGDDDDVSSQVRIS